MSRKLIALGAAAIVAAALSMTGQTTSAAGQAPTANPQRGGDAGQAPAGGEGRGGGRDGRGGGGGGRGAAPEVPDDNAGFTSLFDGKTLTGWDGDPMFWRTENGIIVAESTPEKVVADNTFLIWKAGTLKNFELKVDVRFAAAAGNSGIQVRSRPFTAPTSRSGGQPRPWGIAGYQIDVVNAGGTGTAPIFEEGGRGFIARQGQITRRVRDAQGAMSTKVIGTVGDNVAAVIKPAGEWNSFHVVAIGNQITSIVNGRIAAMAIDDDEQGRALEGLLALQMHVGAPFRVEFRNVYVKHLP